MINSLQLYELLVEFITYYISDIMKCENISMYICIL